MSTVGADRWSDLLTLAAAVIGLAVLVVLRPRPRRDDVTRRRHPSWTSPVVVESVDTADGPRWRVSLVPGATPTSLDIFTWRRAGSDAAWAAEPIVEPLAIEPGGFVVLGSGVAEPTAPHDVVLAWTTHRGDGDVQGSGTLRVEAGSVDTAPLPPQPTSPTWLWAGHAVLGAALVVLGLIALLRLVDPDRTGGDVSAPPTSVGTTTPTSVPSATSSPTDPATDTTAGSSPGTSPGSSPPSTSPPAPSTPTTAPTDTTTPSASTTVPSDGRIVTATGRIEPCRFGDECLVVGFELQGFDPEGTYVCEFGDGSRFEFRYLGDGAADACATSGDEITVEVDGVRSTTVTRSSVDGA